MRSVQHMGAIVAIGIISVANVAIADNVSEFKAAVAAGRGCASIPYPDLQAQCVEVARVRVEGTCKSSDAWNCDIGVSGTRDLLAIINNIGGKIESLEQEVKVLAKSISDTKDTRRRQEYEQKIESKRREIDEFAEKIKTHREYLNENTRKLSARLETGESCRDARIAAIALFDVVRDRMTKEVDPRLKEHVADLLDIYIRERSSHVTEFGRVKLGIEKCLSKLEGWK